MSPHPVVGTCYGYAINSPLEFNFLRAGSGEELAVREHDRNDVADPGRLLQEWKSPEPPPQEIHIYADGDAFRIWSTHLGWFEIDPTAPSVGVPRTERLVAREHMTLITSLALCFQGRGDLPIHAAAIEVGGEAIILAGPGMFGKTTLAAGFWRAGHRVLTEDLVCLRHASHPAVIPGPAMLRLRRDVATEMELPDAEPIVADRARVCLAFSPDRRGDCEPVPVRAIVFPLAAEDELRIEAVDAPTALRNLWALCGLFADDEAFAPRRFQAVADLADSVPAYNLHRPVRLDALDRTVDQIVSVV